MENSQQLLPWSTEPSPRGQHNNPGVRALKNRSTSEWNPWNKPEGSEADGSGQLCKAAISRSLLLGWQMVGASSSLPCKSNLLVHIREKENCHNPMYVPNPETIPRTAFPGQNKGLEPARNLLRNRCLLGSLSLQQVWTKPLWGSSEGREKSGAPEAGNTLGTVPRDFRGS